MRMILLREILMPLLRRAGTALGAVLVTYGVNADTVTQITTGLTAAAMVSIDLINSWLERRGR